MSSKANPWTTSRRSDKASKIRKGKPALKDKEEGGKGEKKELEPGKVESKVVCVPKHKSTVRLQGRWGVGRVCFATCPRLNTWRTS